MSTCSETTLLRNLATLSSFSDTPQEVSRLPKSGALSCLGESGVAELEVSVETPELVTIALCLWGDPPLVVGECKGSLCLLSLLTPVK